MEDLGLLGRAGFELFAIELRRAADRQGGAHAERHDLDRAVERGTVHEGAVVGVGEQARQIGRVERIETLGRDLDTDLEGLSYEAHVERVRVVEFARQLHVGELRGQPVTHLAEDTAGVARRRVVELHLARDGVELGVVGRDQAVGRDHAGIGRHDDGRDAQLLGDARGMERARTAERHQRVVARIAPALGRDELDGAHDVGVGELQCRGSGLLDAQRKALGQRLEGAACGFAVELHTAAEEGTRPDRADDDMGVGGRGLGAAAAITGRAGIGAGALRADAQHAAIVDPGERAAAGAHGNDVEHGRADRQAVDLGLGGQRGPAILHQADVGRGATHVEGDEILVARAGGLARGADHAGGGT